MTSTGSSSSSAWTLRARSSMGAIAIAITAFVYATGGQSDSSEATQSFSAQLLATPGGVFLLVLVGVLLQLLEDQPVRVGGGDLPLDLGGVEVPLVFERVEPLAAGNLQLMRIEA